MEKKKQTLWKIVALIALVVIAAAISLLYVFVLKPQPVAGNKSVEVVMIAQDEGTDPATDLRLKFNVRTDAEFFDDILMGLSEQFGLKLKFETEGPSAGMLMEGFGLKTPPDWTKYFYYYTDDPAVYNPDNPYEGKYVNYGDKQYGSGDYGISVAPIHDETSFVLVYAEAGKYSATNPLPVVQGSGRDAEVWVTEEMKGYVRQLQEANQILMTVLIIVGAAIVAIVALFVEERFKSRRSKVDI